MVVPVAVPKLGNRMRGGLVAEWYQPDGANVREGEPVCRLECDFVAFDIEAEGDGVLRHRLDAGLVRPPGDLLGVILGGGERMPQFEPVDLEALLPDPGEMARAAAEEPRPDSERLSVELGSADWVETGPQAGVLPGYSGEPNGEPTWFDLGDMTAEPHPGTEEAPAAMREASAWVEERAGGEGQEIDFRPATDETALDNEQAQSLDVSGEPPAPALTTFPRRFQRAQEEESADAWGLVPGDSADFATGLFPVRDTTLEPHVEPATPAEGEPESREFAAWLDCERDASGAALETPAEPGQDWRRWSEEAVERARRERQERREAGVAPRTMRVTLALAEGRKMRESLTREWRATGLQPAIEDVLLRAAARAFRDLPVVQAGSLALRTLAEGGEQHRVLSNAAIRPFRDAVESLAAAGEVDDIDCTVTSFATQAIEEAAPALEPDQLLALALGCERVEPLWDGERFVPQAVATLTLAWDPAQLGEGAAARFLARVHELVESPYALLAD